MKRLALIAALLLSAGTARAASTTLANAQVLIDPATGLLQSLPVSGAPVTSTGEATAALQTAGNLIASNIYADLTTTVNGITYGTFTTNGNNLTPAALVVIGAMPGFNSATNALRVGLTGTAGLALQTTQAGIFGRLTSTPQGTPGDPIQVDSTVVNFPLAFPSVGNVANGVADSGSPLKIGGVGRTSLPTSVSDGDRVNASFDKLGRQLVSPGPRELRVKGNIALTDTTLTTVITAGAAGIFRDLRLILVSNSGTADVTLTFNDGTVSIPIHVASKGGGAVVCLAANWPATTAATAWTAQLSASPGGGGSVFVNVLAEETR